MGYYINSALGYYEGDQIDPSDRPALQRPDATYAPVMAASPVSWAATSVTTNGPILGKIDTLENSITNRMWREDAVAYPTPMSGFPEGDPRNGLTSTQYIAWVNTQIATLRGSLAK
jgi:hypothetical protein